MNQTQQKIYDFLQKHTFGSALEISAALGMTSANIRHHLALMIQGGLVDVNQQPPNGRGRPTYRYSLNVQAQPHNLDALANALLIELLSQCAPADRLSALQRLAARLLDILASGAPLPSPGVHLTRRMSRAIQILNACRYQARWEAHANGPRLMLGHCPYAVLLAQHPELCQVDGFMLEKLIGVPVRQIARIGQDSPTCIFQVV